MRWKREIGPSLRVFAVHTIAAFKAPDQRCEIDGDQECDEDNEYHHGLFFLSCFSACSFTQECFNLCLDTSLSYLCYTRKRTALLWPRTQFGCELEYRETEYRTSHHSSHLMEPNHQWMRVLPGSFLLVKGTKNQKHLFYRSRKSFLCQDIQFPEDGYYNGDLWRLCIHASAC